MRILKFGGSSLATPDHLRRVARIILDAARKENVIVVVSAFQNVTNQLLQSARAAAAHDPNYKKLYRQLVERHRKAAEALLGRRLPKRRAEELEQLFSDLHDVLHGINLLHDSPPRTLDLAASFGERMSALILAAFLNRYRPARALDAREFVITDDQFTHANVLFPPTNRKIRDYFKETVARERKRVIPVVTGFIGATEDGRTTTIGRNGSDYTASIIGAALDVAEIEIWTDVDGVMSADPRVVPTAFVLSEVSYEEAMELSYFGANVLHSATIAPAIRKNIPIRIKNTLNPSAPGTRISRRVERWDGVAKGITAIDGITLLTLRGLSMVGVPGTAERLFRALANSRVNVILISQASSEHTICFAISTPDAPRARKAIKDEFRYEFEHGLTTLDEKPQQTIVAIVGDGMKGTPGVAGKVFQALGRNIVNVSAIAQGASERNISFVIDSSQKVRGLNVIHQAFFEKKKRLALVVVGVGNIGSALLRQIHQQRSYLLSVGFDVQVVGVANSKRYVLDPNGIDLTRWKEVLASSPHRMDAVALAKRVAEAEFTNTALVDCTASPAVVDAYEEFVQSNMHIITPNKRANVLPWRAYERLMNLMRQRQKHFLYEANVGAGLPVISTIRDLIASGDTIFKIEGVFSGTLSYLFNQFDGSRPFSELVREAHALAFTEPDPRDDLSGQDVARKLLILARQIGRRMNLQDISVENLVPLALRTGSFTPRFFRSYSQFDNRVQQRFDRARRRNSVLRYVGTLEGNSASAALREIPADHPIASTKGSDNIIALTTARYSRTPLVVQGPGAGADVTAAGVFSDILKLLHYLPY